MIGNAHKFNKNQTFSLHLP